MTTDAITLLKEDHRKVERLYEEFQAAGSDTQRRNELKNAIVRELSIHAVIEEEYLYPATVEALSEGDDLASHSIDEHQEIKEVLNDVDSTTPDDPALDGKLATLMDDVNHHVAEEEGELFPKLSAALGPQRLTELGEKLEKAKLTAPTRPHPSAPNTSPANKVAGAPAAAMDRARDASRDFPDDV